MRKRRAWLYFTVVLAIGMAASWIVFSIVRQWEESGTRDLFMRKAEVNAQALHRAVRYNIEIVYSLRNCIESMEKISPEEYRAFVTPTLLRHKGIESLTWMKRTPDGRFIVNAIEPAEKFASSVGYDVSAKAEFREPILRAMTLDTVVSNVIRAGVLNDADPAAIVFFLTVKKGDTVLGCVASACLVDRMIEATYATYPTEEMNLFFRDADAPDTDNLIGAIGSDTAAVTGSDIVWIGRFEAADRNWMIECRPSRAFLESRRRDRAWAVLGAGFLVSLVISLYFRRIFARAQQVEEVNRLYTEELARRDERMREELALAQAIQRALLPSELPRIRGLEFGLKFVPSGEVGGDFYNFLVDQKNRRVAVLLADISGHGVPAALLFAIFKAFAEEAFQGAVTAPEALTLLNRRLTKHFPRGRFASTFYALFDAEARTMTYVKASQEPGILFPKNDAPSLLEDGGPLLGAFNPDVFGDPGYEAHTVKLGPGDTVFLFTDGLVEVEGKTGELLGVDGVIPWIREELDRAPQELVDQLHARTVAYAVDGVLRDDFTAMVIRLTEG